MNILFLAFFFFSTLNVSIAQSTEKQTEQASTVTTEELVLKAWKFSTDNNLEELDKILGLAESAFGPEAKSQAAQLSKFPSSHQRSNFKVMSDVATIQFVKAEALMRLGKTDESKALFQSIIENYPWAQAWDPSRGSFWSVREKSEMSICVMEGRECTTKPAIKVDVTRTVPKLAFPGKDRIIDYRKYGNFLNVGTKDYHYQITDKAGLIAAAGEGIYPNIMDVYKDPGYKKALKEGRLEGSHWDFVNSIDLEAAFYKWATASESWGTRLFYIGMIFEKAKMYPEAIKAYHSIVVHFPGAIAWTYWHTPWYPSQAAISKIRHIIRMHPELKLEFKWAKISIMNSFDNDSTNDITITKPGVVRELNAIDQARETLHLDKPIVPLGGVVKTLGEGHVRFVKYESGHWQLQARGKPYIIKGVTYSPTKVGQSPDNNTLTNWMDEDTPFKAFVDKNLNNKQDADEPSEGDFAIMKDMGLNTLRIYHHPKPPNKEMLNKMHQEYGFMVIMGDYLGKYAIGSGANFIEGTDYENPEHQQRMMESVRQMVLDHKDEPYILMWLIGNENNYGVASNADKKPDAYFKFVNEVAKMIKSIDPNHPVALCNGDTLFLDKFAKLSPDVDAFAANVYRGDYGFGSFWQQVAEATDRPAFITEYGAPSFGDHMTYQEAQEAQASYHRGNWLDILHNSAGYEDGIGNSVGGVTFEWLDEWWKNYEPAKHDTKADAVGPFPGGYYFEEWFGLFGQGDGKESPYLREPRKVYYTYKELWN